MYLKIVSFIAAIIIFGGANSAAAQNNQQNVQSDCFTTLQKSVLATPAFSAVHAKVTALRYEEVEGSISKYYKNASSFGIDLNSGDFDMRIYSFGRETGYQHPPFSPFPTYSLSDKWETPAKEYIYAEEYVRNTATNERLFISCAFMTVESRNLLGVTAERYLHDGALSSVRYTSPDQSYKVWYSSNDSFDHEERNFVTWRRMFVYPKATVNPFFDKYTVADAFPAKTTANLGDIKKFRSREHTAETRDLLVLPELKEYDAVFALNSYYQAIENSFPQFSAKLALRGVLPYGTVKELLATRGIPEFATLWKTILDPRALTIYALAKEKGELTKDNGDGIIQPKEESPLLEAQLQKIKDLTLDQEAKQLLKENADRNALLAEGEQPLEAPTFYQKYRLLITIGGVVLVMLLSGLLVTLRKRRITSNDNVA